MDFFTELSRGSDFCRSYRFPEAYSVFHDLSLHCSPYEAKFLYPKFIFCLRCMNRYDELFYTLSFVRKKYGKSVVTPFLLAPAISAYCDVGRFRDASLCYDYALRLDSSLSSLDYWKNLRLRIDNRCEDTHREYSRNLDILNLDKISSSMFIGDSFELPTDYFDD